MTGFPQKPYVQSRRSEKNSKATCLKLVSHRFFTSWTPSGAI
jgi:hypothetical protein